MESINKGITQVSVQRRLFSLKFLDEYGQHKYVREYFSIVGACDLRLLNFVTGREVNSAFLPEIGICNSSNIKGTSRASQSEPAVAAGQTDDYCSSVEACPSCTTDSLSSFRLVEPAPAAVQTRHSVCRRRSQAKKVYFLGIFLGFFFPPSMNKPYHERFQHPCCPLASQ